MVRKDVSCASYGSKTYFLYIILKNIFMGSRLGNLEPVVILMSPNLCPLLDICAWTLLT